MPREHPPVIAIIGLGPVGLAIGRSLARVRTDFRLVGHDRSAERVKAAAGAGAIDEGRWNLVSAVADADLVILTEPLDQTLITLEQIAPHVRAGALVTDTTPVMRPLLRLAAAVLPGGVSFASGHPVLGGPVMPAMDGVDQPFANVTYCIVPAPSADAAAVRVLVDLIEAIGARPYFIDADEHDALVTAVDQLPFLAGAALARVLGRSPSADDLARLMPPAARAMWLAAGREPTDSAAAALTDQAAVLAWLDAFARELAHVRAQVAAGDAEALGAWLVGADSARDALIRSEPGARAGGAGGVAGDPWADVQVVNPLRSLLLGRRKGR